MVRIATLACAIGALTLSASLARSALHAWRRERAGAVYELPIDLRGAYLRGGAAAAALLTAAALAFVPSGYNDGPHPSPVPRVEAASTPAARPRAPRDSRFVRSAPAYGGTWWHAVSHGVPLNLWLPPTGTRTPLLVVVAPPDLLPDIAAVEKQAEQPGKPQGKRQAGNPSTRVAPLAPLAPFALLAAAPGSPADTPRTRAAIRAAFPALARTDRGWGALGADRSAPGAVGAALAAPGRYPAGVGISGRYPPRAACPARGARILLVAAHRDRAGTAAAQRLRAALGTRAQVHVSTSARDYRPDRERFRLVRQALVYLGQNLRPI